MSPTEYEGLIRFLSKRFGEIDQRLTRAELNSESLRDEVRTVAEGVSDNGRRIDRNAALIEENAGRIEHNATLIEANRLRIDRNAALIEENTRRIDRNAKRIDRNGRRIDRNAELIRQNGDRIVALENRLGAA